jgi:hypothetical protein
VTKQREVTHIILDPASITQSALDLVQSTDREKDCKVCMGYNRGLVPVRHPTSHTTAATTASLLLAIIFLALNPGAGSKDMVCTLAR